MQSKTIAVAAAFAATAALAAPQAMAAKFDVITDGSATLTFTADFDSYFLSTNWDDDENGNPSRTLNAQSTGTNAQGYPTDSGSQLVPGGANLTFGRSSVYLYPTDVAGDEVESEAEVTIFNFRESDPSVTDEMKGINYVPTGNPGEYEDIETGELHTLTPHQESLLQDSTLRTCCRHTLNGFQINTVDNTVVGVIDSITDRDGDGFADNWVLFGLAETGVEGVFDLVMTEIMAEYLNYGFTPPAFLDGTVLAENWGYYQDGFELMDFAAGDVVGTAAVEYTVGQTTAVPVPAALPLLAAGLGAFGLLGARRKRMAA